MSKHLTTRFGVKRRRYVVNELMRRREEQEEAKREYERQAELRSREWVPVISGCDREFLLAMKVEW